MAGMSSAQTHSESNTGGDGNKGNDWSDRVLCERADHFGGSGNPRRPDIGVETSHQASADVTAHLDAHRALRSGRLDRTGICLSKAKTRLVRCTLNLSEARAKQDVHEVVLDHAAVETPADPKMGKVGDISLMNHSGSVATRLDAESGERHKLPAQIGTWRPNVVRGVDVGISSDTQLNK